MSLVFLEFHISAFSHVESGTGYTLQDSSRCEVMCMFVTSHHTVPHSIKMPAPLGCVIYHLQLAISATCMSVIRPVVSLWGEPSSTHWFNAMRTHIAHIGDRSVLQLTQNGHCGVFRPKACFNSKSWRLCFCVIIILTRLPFASFVFRCFCRCFEWESPVQMDLILFICVVFSNVVSSWKNA